MKFTPFLYTLLLQLLLLTACTTLDNGSRQPAAVQAPQPSAPQQPEPEPQQDIPERAFPIETFYALLVAEIAGSRERYDVALGNYMQQARTTRDPDIAARATRIARFLNARQAALESALLWVEVSPEDSEANFSAATELIDANRLLEATRYSLHLLENDNSTLYQTIASRASRLTDSERVALAEEYRQVLLEYPGNTDLLVGLGMIARAMGRNDEAMDFAREALAVDPEMIPAAVLEANLLGEMGQPQEALRRISELLDAQPDNTRLRLQYARMLASSDMDQAYRQFKILLQQRPGDENLILSLGLVCYQQGLNEEARTHFTTLAESESHSSVAHYYLGRIAESDKDWQLALEHYLRVAPGPNFMTALLRTTEILVGAGESSAAGKRLAAARQRFPDQAERLFLLEAEVLVKYRHLESALSLIDSAVLELPDSTQLLYSRAMIYAQLDKLDSLEIDLRSILRQEPDNATALNALGYTLADKTDRFVEARQLIAQALQLKPEDPAILDSMGWVEYRLGNMEEALLLLQQAMEAMPDHEIAAHLGEVLWTIGRQQEAREVLGRGLRLNPGSSIIAEVIKRLNIVEVLADPAASPENQ